MTGSMTMGAAWAEAQVRRPFLSNRPRRSLGVGLADIGSFLLNMISTGVGVIADLVKVPTEILTQGVGLVFTNIAAVIGQIPIIGELAAQILLAANAVIGWALAAPGALLEGVSNVFGNLAKALDAAYGQDEKQAKMDAAKGNIVDRAPAGVRDQVREILDRTPPPTGGTPTVPRPPGSPPAAPDEGGIGEALVSVGLPVAGAAAVLLLLTR